MPRQSTSRRDRADDLDFIVPDDEIESDHIPPPEPSTKRRKTDTSAVSTSRQAPKKTRRGNLKQLAQMPWDILLEIFGHLDPLDVLHMSRLTKEFRGVLMRRSAISVWQQALSNIEGLPPLPEDLNQPQYAHLAFDPHCHHCSATVQTAIWHARTRACKDCLPDLFLPLPSLSVKLPTGIWKSSIREAKFQEMVPWITTDDSIQTSDLDARLAWYRPRFYLPFAIEFSEEWESLAPEHVDAWIDKKIGEHKMREAHAGLCLQWLEKRAAKRTAVLRQLRVKRKSGIIAKLTELGYGDEIAKMEHGEFERNSYVNQAKELTPRIWANIEAPLIEFMKATKRARLAQGSLSIRIERTQVMATALRQYQSKKSPSQLSLSAADVTRLEPFRVLIEDTPLEDDVLEKDFTSAFVQLPSLIEEWIASKDQQLLEIMNASHTTSAPNLALATTFFRCFGCLDPISYPRALVHAHATLLRSTHAPNEKDTDQTQIFKDLKCEPWNHGGGAFSFFHEASKAAELVVKACGLDPATATASEMDEADPMVECKGCRTSKGRMVMHWRRAVMHGFRDHKRDTPHWTLISAADRATAIALEAIGEVEKNSVPGLFIPPDYCCGQCQHRSPLDLMKNHLILEHKLNVVEQKHYYAHPDATTNVIPQAVRIL